MILNKRVSIVIATIRPHSVLSVINVVRSFNLQIHEIIVVFPRTIKIEKSALEKFSDRRCTIHFCDVANQVHQRIHGLKASTGEIIVQMDDDISFSKGTFLELVQQIDIMGENNIVGVNFRTMPVRIGLIRKILFGIKGEGTIAKAGFGVGVSPMNQEFRDTELIRVEWVPGGLCGYFRENIITDVYLDPSSKSFNEDVIASLIWESRGCAIWLSNELKVFNTWSHESIGFKDLLAMARNNLWVVRQKGFSPFWFCMWFLVSTLQVVFKRKFAIQ